MGASCLLLPCPLRRVGWQGRRGFVRVDLAVADARRVPLASSLNRSATFPHDSSHDHRNDDHRILNSIRGERFMEYLQSHVGVYRKGRRPGHGLKNAGRVLR